MLQDKYGKEIQTQVSVPGHVVSDLPFVKRFLLLDKQEQDKWKRLCYSLLGEKMKVWEKSEPEHIRAILMGAASFWASQDLQKRQLAEKTAREEMLLSAWGIEVDLALPLKPARE